MDQKHQKSLPWDKDDEKPLLVEVGTTSLFKVWMNLEATPNFIYLLVPNDERLIEFTRTNHPPRLPIM